MLIEQSKFVVQVPVVDGYSFPHLTKRMNIAGRHITSYLVDLLSRRGCELFFIEQSISKLDGN